MESMRYLYLSSDLKNVICTWAFYKIILTCTITAFKNTLHQTFTGNIVKTSQFSKRMKNYHKLNVSLRSVEILSTLE